MVTRRRRKCLCCDVLFKPDPRQQKRQRYCSAPACRKASKATSQKKWLDKKENKHYFAGPANVQRVKEWRQANPEYWRRNKQPLAEEPLQETSLSQLIENKEKTDTLANQPLQDLTSHQVTVLIGLIAHLTGDTLQDQIANTTRHLLTLGADILANTTKQDAASSGVFYENRTNKSPSSASRTQTI